MTVANTRPVKGESLREQVLRSLRWGLFTGEFEPDSTFSVPVLAEQFGVSITPVREAVLELVRQQLLVALPNKGLRVVKPTTEQLLLSLQVRRLLEIPTTVDIARAITVEQLEPLRELAAQTMQAAACADLKAFVAADYEFHWTLTARCGNPILSELIDDLRSRARVVVVPRFSESGTLEATASEHLDLLDAMGRADLVAVQRITKLHMERTFHLVSDDQE